MQDKNFLHELTAYLTWAKVGEYTIFKTNVTVPRFFEEKRRDSVLPYIRPPIEECTLWRQLLQFYTDSFETSLVFWSFTEDMHVI